MSGVGVFAVHLLLTFVVEGLNKADKKPRQWIPEIPLSMGVFQELRDYKGG